MLTLRKTAIETETETETQTRTHTRKKKGERLRSQITDSAQERTLVSALESLKMIGLFCRIVSLIGLLCKRDVCFWGAY